MTSEQRVRQAPVERFDADSLVFDLHREVESLRAEPRPTRQGHRQKVLFKHGGRTIALFVVEAGSGLPQHTAAGTVSVQAVEGEFTLSVSGETHTLRPGGLMVIAPRVPHDVHAVTDGVFLLQVSLVSTGG